MARSSRLSVCLAIVMRNSSNIHCARSISRQRPAPPAWPPGGGATFDHAGDGLPLSVVELGRLSCRLAIQETVRTAGVEAQHLVPDDLKSDTADLGRLGARCPIVDSREC